MGFGAFLGGAAKGAGDELDTQEAQAFKLKLMNAQIEAEVAKAKELSAFEANSPEVTQRLGEYSGTKLPLGSRANKADETAMLGMGKADSALKMAQARMYGGGSGGMTRDKFNKLYQVETPGDPNDWMNNTEVLATRDRLKREEPTAAQTQQYDTSERSKNLIQELWTLRQDAEKEGGVGAVRGFGTRADAFVTGGKLLPKSVAFINSRKAAATLFAKMYGDTGNIAWKEAERAVNALGDERLDKEAAEIQYDSLNRILDHIKDSMLKSSPGLRRKVQREIEGTNMRSLSDAKRAGLEQGLKQTQPLDLDAVEAQIRAMEQEAKQPRR